jgi:hypothetical protein
MADRVSKIVDRINTSARKLAVEQADAARQYSDTLAKFSKDEANAFDVARTASELYWKQGANYYAAAGQFSVDLLTELLDAVGIRAAKPKTQSPGKDMKAKPAG